MLKKGLLIIVLFLLATMVFYSPSFAKGETTVTLPEGLQPITVENSAQLNELAVFDAHNIDLPKFAFEGDLVGNTEWLRAIMTAAVTAGMSGASVSSDFSMMAVPLIEEVLFVADVKNARAVAKAQWLGGEFEDAVSASISPDKSTIAVGDENGMVTLLDIKTKAQTAIWQAEADYAYVAYNPDGSFLATGSQGIHLWDAATGEQVSELAASGSVDSLDFSADGSLLAVGNDESIILWEVAGGEQIATLESHTDYVASLAFSSDGSLLATGSSDGTIYLWDVSTKELLASLSGELSETDYLRTVVFLDFSPDSALLLSSNQDGLLHLWGTTG